MKGTWLRGRKRGRGVWGSALAEGAEGPAGSGPGQIQEPVVPGEGFPLLFPVAAWSALP